MSNSLFTVCVLLYGDHPELARRVLFSLVPFSAEFELRVGLNDVSAATRAIVNEVQEEKGVSLTVFTGHSPYYKYPLMRQMFYSEAHPLVSPYVMWFDDDSFIKVEAPRTWFNEITQYFVRDSPVDMLGKVYQGVTLPHGKGLQGTQPLWVESQPWYTGKPVSVGHQPRFCTGGWWATRTTIINRWNWPPPGDYHNCGDFIFGELFTQQDYKIKNFDSFVAINADEFGRESRAIRRGAQFVPLGVNCVASVAKDCWMDVLDSAL